MKHLSDMPTPRFRRVNEKGEKTVTENWE